MTKILVDLLFYSGRRGGTETYTREIYRRLGDLCDFEFVAFASTEAARDGLEWFPGEIVDSGISGFNRAAWAYGELFAVDRAARRIGADLVHCPANLGPIRPRVPTVVTLHDLLVFRHPEWLPTRSTELLLRVMIKGAARRATHIITDSEASRHDIESVLSIPSASITVTPLAAGEVSAPEGIARRTDALFAPGNRMPHKNIGMLIEALAQIPVEVRPTLTITGSQTPDPLRAVVDRFRMDEWVTLVGWLSATELERHYAEATAVVFPTRFEGFGLPVLEGMARGVPVICSDLPVLREVGGDAAVYFDPSDPGQMASTITEVLARPDQRSSMVELGLSRARQFSWDRAARQTLEVFTRSLAAGPRHDTLE